MTMPTVSTRQTGLMKVLIVEGESNLGNEFTEPLVSAGFSVANVPNHPESLLALEVFKPDIIILDEVLADSMEACRQLHTTFGIPVILVGTDPGQEIWKRALLGAEADFYLRKPFSYAVLVARMRAILRRYRRQMPNVSDYVFKGCN